VLLCLIMNTTNTFATEKKQKDEVNLFKTEITAYEEKILIEKLIEENPEQIKNVPLFNQLDYSNTAYGNYGTVASHGCGITCLSMVASYLTDEFIMPDKLAKKFGSYNTSVGSSWSLFPDSAKALDIELKNETNDRDEIMKALKNGQPVISSQRTGLFTGGGHFIVLVGINDDGRIIVNDPNGDNYFKNDTLKYGFNNGFTKDQVFDSSVQCWIYGEKELKYELDKKTSQ